MLSVLVSLVLLLFVSTSVSAYRSDATVNSLDTRLAELDQRIAVLEQKVDDKEDAQILFYRDRSTCPIGYKPMENAYGRTIVLGADSRGKVSVHTLQDNPTLSIPCKNVIGVAESGFHRVCNMNTENSTQLTVDVKNLIPHVVLLGCAKVDPSKPVVP